MRPKTELIIPFYHYPSPESADVKAVIENADRIDSIILNVHDGPGPAQRDPNYVSFIAKLRGKRTRLYGYVATNYGNRDGAAPLITAQAHIGQWEDLWGITNIFLDEAATESSKLAYYEALNRSIKGKSMLNQGTVMTDSEYLQVGDYHVMAETEWATYKTKQFPPWMTGMRERFCHMVIGAKDASTASLALDRARPLAKQVFVSNFVEPAVYKRLPSYFTRLLGKIEASNQEN